ncbi:MAG: DUF1634 domain-containing protein [Acidobacteria bacterium]|nr:DUF1634 domain-containing protein [Acidobacteriota bacterium]
MTLETADSSSPLDRTGARLLTWGVMLSALCTLTGLCVWLTAAGDWRAIALLNAGLMMLMGTPILRLCVAVAQFAQARDWFFLLTTLAVVAVLLTTLLLAAGQR